MKKVLIIAYYWPPSAGSGVQRWLKFVKYLPQYDWQPIVYTPEDPSFDVKDEGLKKDVPKEAKIVKKPIWEPYGFHKKIFGKSKSKSESNAGIVSDSSSGLSAKISNWIRGNIFIPDPKIFWVKPSIKFLNEYLKENPVDVLISTGTPHSMHLIAKELADKLDIPWVADFRDPWSKLDMLNSYHISRSNFKKYQELEQGVLRNADLCLTTSEIWRADFLKLGAKKAYCITNGYDEDDFCFEIEPYKKFVISHFGLLNHLRNPTFFWQALAELCEENNEFNEDLKIHLGGSIDQSNLDEINSYKPLRDKLKVFSYLSHEDVLKEYAKSSILLLLLFNSESGVGNIPGKLFEYLASKKPIIGFGAGMGDSARIIEQCSAGDYFDYQFSDVEKMKEAILKHYNSFMNGKTMTYPLIDRYSRKSLTEALVRELNSLCDRAS